MDGLIDLVSRMCEKLTENVMDSVGLVNERLSNLDKRLSEKIGAVENGLNSDDVNLKQSSAVSVEVAELRADELVHRN